jgi:hypothetical protein
MDPADDELAPAREGRHRAPGNRFRWDFGSNLRVYLMGLGLTICAVGYGVDRLRGCGGTCQQSVPIGLLFALAPILAVTVAVAVAIVVVLRRR